jgi:hypothetical protein
MTEKASSPPNVRDSLARLKEPRSGIPIRHFSNIQISHVLVS